MDEVSGLADESKKFAKFLTVARKFNYTYIYIFQTIYPKKIDLENDSFADKYF